MAIDDYWRNSNFIFPTTLQRGMVFENLQDLQQFIKQQATQNCQNCQKFFTKTFRPSEKSWRYAYYICRKYPDCPARLSVIKRAENQLTVRKVQNFHVHSRTYIQQNTAQMKLEPMVPKIKQEYIQNAKESFSKRQYTKRLIPMSQPLTDLKAQSLKKQYDILSKCDKYQDIVTFLFQQKYQYLQHGQSPHTADFPQTLVMCSDPMKQLYRNYSDILVFKVINGMVSQSVNRWKCNVGVFAVRDVNYKLQVVALALFESSEKETYEKIFELFFQLQGSTKEDLVVMTEDEREVEAAVKEMQMQQSFKGSHVVDTNSLINNLKNTLKSDDPMYYKLIGLSKSLLQSRNQTKALQILNSLVTSHQQNHQTIIQFMSKASQAVYYKLPQSYYGFQRTSPTDLHSLIKCQFPSPIPLLGFLIQLDGLLNLHRQSAYKMRCFSSQLDSIYRNSRMVSLRHSIPKIAFRRFFESMIRFWQSHFEILQTTQQGDDLVFTLTNGGQKWNVVDWSCSCGEKSGVPCEHLIRCAEERQEMKYEELFKRRWFRREKGQEKRADLRDVFVKQEHQQEEQQPERKSPYHFKRGYSQNGREHDVEESQLLSEENRSFEQMNGTVEDDGNYEREENQVTND